MTEEMDYAYQVESYRTEPFIKHCTPLERYGELLGELVLALKGHRRQSLWIRQFSSLSTI